MNANSMSGYDRWMVARMNDPRGRVLYATAARRRTAVAAHVVMTVATVALYARLFSTAEIWPLVPLLLLLLPWCVTTGTLNSATGGVCELRSRALDERQLAERERARAVAHKMTGALIVGAAVGLWAGALLTDGLFSTAPVAAVLAGVFVLHWLMPLWVAGVLVKDEPADEFEDDAVPSYS
jgi:hypothetical protein